jgi:UDP-glucuronate 4-epimerase
MATLVTGGCGFVGINLAEALSAQGEQAVLFDRNPLPLLAKQTLQDAKVPPVVITGDVRDKALLAKAMTDAGVQRVIHAAVITAGKTREAERPGDIVEVNVKGTISVLEAAHAAGCSRVVCVSSGSAYGRTLDEAGPLHEEVSASRPETLYAITKLAAEAVALRLGALWHRDVAAVRLGTLFGPWEFNTGVRDTLSLPLQLLQLALRGETAVLPAKEVRRDWIYSRDVAAGLAAVVRARGAHRVYHLAAGGDWKGSMPGWCETLKKEFPAFSWRTGERPNVSYHAEADRALMDTGRLAADFGFKARYGAREALEDYLSWIRRNPGFFTSSSAPAGT